MAVARTEDYIKIKNANVTVWLNPTGQPSHIEIRADDYHSIYKIDEAKMRTGV